VFIVSAGVGFALSRLSRRPSGSAAAPVATVPESRPAAVPVATVPESRPAAVGLELVRGDTGERIPLRGGPVTVGRSPDNTIVASDDRVSRSHARLEPAAKGWVVIDLGSANGTRVDGTPITPHTPTVIRAGSTIGTGPLELSVVARREDRAIPRPTLDEAEPTRILPGVVGEGRWTP